MEEYKGIYYGDDTERKFFEGGAHFKYSKLYKILEKLAKERNAREKKEELLYVHKSKNLNKKKNIKKTRNIIDNIDLNKFQFNTINNNFNNINYNFQNNYNIYLSLDKGNINNKIGNELSINNHKKKIDSRNQASLKALKGRPNTLLKDGLQKLLDVKEKKLLSTSMEQKTIYKMKGPVNLKKAIPDIYPNFNQTISNINISKGYKTNSFFNLNTNKNNYIKIKVYKNLDKKQLKINKSKINNKINNNDHKEISFSNENKLPIKSERLQIKWIKEKEEKELGEKKSKIKDKNKKEENLFAKINNINEVKSSKRIHDIINKRVIGSKNIYIKEKSKSIITSDIFNKIKIDKDKLDIIINKSNKKKGKKESLNHHVFAKKNLNINQFRTIKKDSSKFLTEKKLINLKKNEQNFKKMNDKFSFNKIIPKSRNYNGENTSFQLKKTFNNNNNFISNRFNKNDMIKNYFKTMGDLKKIDANKINKKNALNISNIQSNNKNSIKNNKNFNYLYKTNLKKNSNKMSISKDLKIFPINKVEIKPYIKIRKNNGLLKKINLNDSIKVNKRINYYNTQRMNKSNSIKINSKEKI